MDKEAAVSPFHAAVGSLMLEPPNLTERGRSNSTTSTSYYTSLSNSHESPKSVLAAKKVEKDEHEVYLENLKLLHFGDIAATAVIGDEFVFEGLTLSIHQNDDDWEEIDIRKSRWQV